MKKETKEKKIRTPEEKKKRRRIIILVVVAVIIALIVVSNIIQSKQPMPVTVSEVKSGSIVQTVDTSGSVSSLEIRSYSAPVSAKVGEICVRKGDYVKSGDILYSFDESDLNEKTELARLKLDASKGGQAEAVERNNITLYRQSEAELNLGVLEQQIADFDAYVKELEKKISDKQAALANEGALLQISLIDWRNYPESEEYINLQKLIQTNAYEQANNAEIRQWKAELQEAQSHLSECKSYEAQMKSQKENSKDSKLTPGGSQRSAAESESSTIMADSSYEAYQAVAGGVKADINGIITEISIVGGSVLNEGAPVLSIASTDDIAIVVKLTKYDLERVEVGQLANLTINGNKYEGKVERISSVAERNESGATVVEALISIDNPDDKLIIGIEAKVSIVIGEADNAILVSNECINYDVEGAFIMVVRGGEIVKQPVTIGLTSDLESQILSGLESNDHYIKGNIESYEEGMKVKEIVE